MGATSINGEEGVKPTKGDIKPTASHDNTPDDTRSSPTQMNTSGTEVLHAEQSALDESTRSDDLQGATASTSSTLSTQMSAETPVSKYESIVPEWPSKKIIEDQHSTGEPGRDDGSDVKKERSQDRQDKNQRDPAGFSEEPRDPLKRLRSKSDGDFAERHRKYPKTCRAAMKPLIFTDGDGPGAFQEDLKTSSQPSIDSCSKPSASGKSVAATGDDTLFSTRLSLGPNCYPVSVGEPGLECYLNNYGEYVGNFSDGGRWHEKPDMVRHGDDLPFQETQASGSSQHNALQPALYWLEYEERASSSFFW